MSIMSFVDNETVIGKINIYSRYIIMHSILYYNHDISLISDYQFDMIGKEAYEFFRSNIKDFMNSKYYYVMKEYEGGTGFFIYNTLSEYDKKYFNRNIQTLYSHIILDINKKR